MRRGADLPRVLAGANFSEVMREMSAKGLGAAIVVDAQDRILGIFTDGDLRRLIENGVDPRERRAADLMHSRPHSIGPGALAAEAASLMEQQRITSVVVVDKDGTLLGALNSNDLMRAKVI